MTKMSTAVNQQMLMIGKGFLALRRINFVLFSNRLESTQESLLIVIRHFEKVGQWFGLDFEKHWTDAVKLLVDEARFVFFVHFEDSEALDRRWHKWATDIMRQLKDADPTLIYEPDQRVLDEFVGSLAAARQRIWQASVETASATLIEIGSHLAHGQNREAERRYEELVAALQRLTDEFETPYPVPLPTLEGPR